MKKNSWIMLLVVFVLVASGMFLASGDMSIYGDLLTFGVVIVLPVLLTRGFHRFRDVPGYFRTARETTDPGEDQVRVAAEYFRRLELLTVVSGIAMLLGQLIFLIRLLAERLNPGPDFYKGVGMAMGSILLSIVYTFLLVIFVTQPRIAALDKKIAGGGQ